MKIFIICPVRNLLEKDKTKLEHYVETMEGKGYNVHYPPRDTLQDDLQGYSICSENGHAIKWADEVHIYWDKDSFGSHFDLGMAFYAEKRIVLINPEDVIRTTGKSFNNLLLLINKKVIK